MTPLKAGLLGFLLLAPGPSPAESFDYLYLEANAGGASGGHVAVRFGEDVYHYQNSSDGSLRLIREHFDFFAYRYSVLQNRTVHMSHIEVDPETYSRLENRFNARHLVEEDHFEALRWRHNDVMLLQRLARDVPGRGGEDPVPLLLRGPGFFDEDEAPGGTSLGSLRRRIEAQQGEDFLARRRLRVERQLARLAPELVPSPPPPASKDRLPHADYTFSQRMVDLATADRALDVLERGAALHPGALRSVSGPEGVLLPAERAALAAFAERLETDLAALAGSARPDWGYPLLLGMARLLALHASLETGRLVVLDAFPLHTRTLTSKTVGTRTLFLEEIREYARSELAHVRTVQLSEGVPAEREYNAVEGAANRYVEALDSLEQQRNMRVYRDRLVPRGEVPMPPELLPRLDPQLALAGLAVASDRERSQRQALREAYGYGLLSRNCVSEIFETINTAFGSEETATRLGGRIETKGPLEYIPFVAFGRVTHEYRISGVGQIPSYRRARLAEMYARENPLQVYLRETNTFTSTVYRRNPDDALFLFFTDDMVWTRPVFGALNLLAGIGQTLSGLLTWPVDGGHALRTGPRGALYSLPELAFFNIRKGSMNYGRSVAHETGLELAASPPAGAGAPAER